MLERRIRGRASLSSVSYKKPSAQPLHILLTPYPFKKRLLHRYDRERRKNIPSPASPLRPHQPPNPETATPRKLPKTPHLNLYNSERFGLLNLDGQDHLARLLSGSILFRSRRENVGWWRRLFALSSRHSIHPFQELEIGGGFG